MNYNHIRGLIRERRLTNIKIASMLGIAASSFYNKLNGFSEFTISEVRRLSEILHVPIEELINDDDKKAN